MELVTSSLQNWQNLILHTSACFILMLACDGGTQHGSSHISNELGTIWLRTINIPQCQGHCGGICLLEPLPIPPPYTSLLSFLSYPSPSDKLCSSKTHSLVRNGLNFCQQPHTTLVYFHLWKVNERKLQNICELLQKKTCSSFWTEGKRPKCHILAIFHVS